MADILCAALYGPIYGMLLAVAWLPRVASAQPNKYSAFDLTGDKLMVTLSLGTTAPAGTLSTFNCKLTTGTSLVIERTTDLPCNAIFAAAVPHDLVFDLVNAGRPSTVALELERGLPSLQVGEYDAESRKLVLGSADINGKVAAFLLPQERWQEIDVQGGKVTVPTSSQLARNIAVYFRTAAGRPIFKVVWRFADKPAKPVAAPKIFDDVCTQDVRTKRATENGATWEILLDGGHSRLDVVKLVRTVDPNTWGIVFVSQPANSDAVLSVDGTVEIANPGVGTGPGLISCPKIVRNSDRPDRRGRASDTQRRNPARLRRGGLAEIFVRFAVSNSGRGSSTPAIATSLTRVSSL